MWIILAIFGDMTERLEDDITKRKWGCNYSELGGRRWAYGKIDRW
jgi:hypothetical protein